MRPVYLPSIPFGDDNIIDVIRRVKGLHRRVPDKDRSYLTDHLLTVKGKAKVLSHWPMKITFGYPGQTQQLEREDAVLQPVDWL